MERTLPTPERIGAGPGRPPRLADELGWAEPDIDLTRPAAGRDCAFCAGTRRFIATGKARPTAVVCPFCR